MKKAIILNFLLPLCTIFAQVPDTLWTRTYGDSSYDIVNGIVAVSDGFIISGSHGKQLSPNVHSSEIWLFKIDENGNVLWNRTYDGMGAGSILRMSENEFIVAAETFTQGSWENMMLMKINDQGDSIWTRTFLFPNSEYTPAVKISDDNSIMVLGYAYPYGTILMKVLSNGDTSWTKFYPEIRGADFEIIDEGGYILLYNKMNSIYIGRLDADGNILSDKKIIDYSYWGTASEILKTPDGNYIALGSTQPAWDTSYIWIHKFNPDLDSVFQVTYNNIDYAGVSKVIQYGTDGFLIVGYSGMFSSQNGLAIKINASGEIIWSSSYGGEGDDVFINVLTTQDNGFIVTGFTSLNPDYRYDGWILKFEPETVTYTEPLSVMPGELYLGQNYPNPFNPSTIIKYSVPTGSHVKIIVYDILGRETARLVDEFKSAGIYEVEFNGNRLNSGVYFYRLSIENLNETRKMALTK